MPPFRSSPLRSRAALAALLLVSAACEGKAADRRDHARAAPSADDDRALRDTLARVIGAEVLGVEVLGDNEVALAEDASSEARWLVVLKREKGKRRIVRRVHTYLPVDTVPGRFQRVEWEGDGAYALLAVGSAWAHGSVALEALLLQPGGEVYRYELTQDGGRNSLSAVWTPNLQSSPHLLASLAAAAHAALPGVRELGDSLGRNAPIMQNWPPLTAQEALDAARQRLGWGVLEAWPVDVNGTSVSRIAVLYARDAGDTRIATLWGDGHVYQLAQDAQPCWGHRFATTSAASAWRTWMGGPPSSR